MKIYTFLATIILLASSCSNSELENGEESINTSDLANYVKKLASDEFMGRKPLQRVKR